MGITLNSISKLIIFTFLVLNLSAKEVTLTAHINYQNSSDKDVAVQHMLTIPYTSNYQKLLDTSIEPKQKFIIKEHKNKEDKYIQFKFTVEKKSSFETKVKFLVDLKSAKLDLSKEFYKKMKMKKYLTSSKNIQLNSKRLKAIINLINNYDSYNKLKFIFSFPSNYIEYDTSYIKPMSIDSILSQAKGGCTQYATLFVALARSIGIPARMSATFNFNKIKKFNMPNHDIAEIYTPEYGWIPVYTNLSRGDLNSTYGLGTISDTVLILKHSNWVWANKHSNKNTNLHSYTKWSIK